MQPVANNMFKLIKKLYRKISGIERREKDIDEFVNTIFQDIDVDKLKTGTIDPSILTVGTIDPSILTVGTIDLNEIERIENEH